MHLIKMHETISKSGKILFVGTKKQCEKCKRDLATINNNFYVNKRWLGGINKLENYFKFN